LHARLEECRAKGKASMIVVVCEGDDKGGAVEIARQVKESGMKYDTRVTLLGHVQRGGNPTVFDRVLGSRLGEAAIRFLLLGETGKMAGIRNQEIVLTPFAEAVKKHEPLNPDLLRLPAILSN
jgi:6-phosphofructokinase 1